MQSPKLYLIPAKWGPQTRGEKAALLAERGLMAGARKDWDAALTFFGQSLRLGPPDVATMNNLAVAQAATGDSFGALQTLRRADELKLCAGLAGGTALANRAMLAVFYDEVEEAVASAEAALSLNPGPVARQAAHVAYTAAGELTRAKVYRSDVKQLPEATEEDVVWALSQHLFRSEGTPNADLTFGCFALRTDLSDSYLDAARAVLLRLPESRLLLFGGGFRSLHVVRRVLERLEGIDGKRLTFDAGTAYPKRLSAMQCCHMILDSFSQERQTALESLYMGVPVVTVHGQASADVLRRIGRNSWVAESVESHADTVVQTVKDRDGLVAARSTLRRSLLDAVKVQPVKPSLEITYAQGN